MQENQKKQNFKEKGIGFASEGQYEIALLSFKKAIEQNPQDATVFEMMAQIYLQLEDDDQAIYHAQKAEKLAPSWPIAHVTMAHCYRNAGQLRFALQSINQAYRLDQSDPQIQEERNELRDLWQQAVAKTIGIQGLKIERGRGVGLEVF
eukprot:TRINITY_DN14604_c0_g1_i4.p2 TRINITY_DN14604_c0_g1~~TRINITY_DN14604_c0_g1_i4.p2  ORF type:complete len:172 (-),score=9.80 TRINITY_DN14604_c0_g1_i4:79-525(-)